MKSKILALLREREDYVSGQELCERFGVSRTAVWKAMEASSEWGVWPFLPRRRYSWSSGRYMG